MSSSSNFQMTSSQINLPTLSNVWSDSPFETITTALHCIQLYSFICCHLVFNYWTGQSYIYYCRKCTNFCQFPVVVVVVFVVLLIAYCCCCVLHNNKKDNYNNNQNKTNENEKIHINWSFCSDYEVFAK